MQTTERSSLEQQEWSEIASRYESARRFSETIVQPLSEEDCVIQSMPDVSPMRWHLAHSTWFFETFLLKSLNQYKVFDSRFEYLFNSYYNTIGEQFPRSRRGLISRPGLEETLAYRAHVDRAMTEWITSSTMTPKQMEVLSIGLNHEQQHQELMLTDIKHVLACNPLDPIYREDVSVSEQGSDLEWIEFDEDLVWIGNESHEFAFDNERPKHRFFLEPFEVANRCVSNGEYQAFIEDGGYDRPEFWLSLGWETVKSQNWTAPMYWSKQGGQWSMFTLGGRKPINADQPVCHVSFFEADAYARWAGFRLPTEQEWEHAIHQTFDQASVPPDSSLSGHWADALMKSGRTVHPQISPVAGQECRLINAIGNLWEWTASQYTAYPGYRAPDGALGEYNGKFMCNQFVLRGGSCATPSGHIRTTYRNFFSPSTRWQFAGIRLAQ